MKKKKAPEPEAASAPETPPMTNALGQFVSANRNPFPLPAERRGGKHEEIDILHPDQTRQPTEKTP